MAKAPWKKLSILFLFGLILTLVLSIIAHQVNYELLNLKLPRSLFYVIRWIITILLFIVVLFFTGILLKEKKSAAILGIIVSGLITYFSYPGIDFLTTSNQPTVAHKAEAKKDLGRIKADTKELEQNLEEKRIPLRDQYQEEIDSHRKKLTNKIPLLNTKTYEELIRKSKDSLDKNELEVINLIEQSAFLKNEIDKLNKEIKQQELLLIELEAIVWKMEKKQELQDLELDDEETRELIDTANSLIENEISSLEDQDIGLLKEKIFDEFN